MSNQPTGYERIHLTINGVDRPVVCDPAKDTLATVIRRMGLTGTKVGCGIGVCGACSIVLNGELCRSCNEENERMSPNTVRFITIEGIGTPQHLPSHPAGMDYVRRHSVRLLYPRLHCICLCAAPEKSSTPPARTSGTGSRRTTTSAAALATSPSLTR